MSTQALAWASSQQVVIDPTARLVLLALANYASHMGKGGHPPLATLATDTGLTERTVVTKLEQLERASLVIVSDKSISAVLGAAAFGAKLACYDLNLHYGITKAA